MDSRAMTVPAAKQAAALRYLKMAADPRRLAKASEAFRAAYRVELGDASEEAGRTLEAASVVGVSEPPLVPCQSIALRRMIDALKADDKIYEACPPVVRQALADIFLPPYSSAEQEILALQADRDETLRLLEKFGARIRDLESRHSAQR